MNNSRFARTAGWLAVPCLLAAGLLAWYVTREPVSRLENHQIAVADIDESAILEVLRRGIDPVFLPRPLRRVCALPRNETGKLPRAALLRLLQSDVQ